MRRIILSILLISLLFVGCATNSALLVRMNEIESQLENTEPQRVGPIINKKRLQELAEAGEAVKIRGFSCTEGGVSGCLDNYPTANLADEDLAMVFNTTTGVMTFHIFDINDVTITQEFDPEYIYPVDRTGNQVWKLFDGFRYMPGANSAVNFRDHDNANIQEVIAKIQAETTITGDGVEDADMTFSVIGAGVISGHQMMVLDGNSGIKIFYRGSSGAGDLWIDDDTYTGIVIMDYEAGESMNQWSMVYFDESAGRWLMADADEKVGGNNWPARGMAVDCPDGWPCGNGDELHVLIHGKVRNDSWNFTQWGEDGTLYLSHIAGGVLDKAGADSYLTTSGDCLQIVGWAIDANTVMLMPSLNWLEVE